MEPPDSSETIYGIIDALLALAEEWRKKHDAAVGNKEKCQAAQAFWSAVRAVLSYYDDGYDWPKRPYPDEDTVLAVPKLLGQMLYDLARDLESGDIPPIVANVQSKGRHKLSTKEREVIRIAVRYVLLAGAGKIRDERPVARVCETYGVARSTVQRWVKQFRKDFDGNLWCRGREFPQRLLAAGEWYRKFGRGVSSLRARDARKRDK